ncbi:hypothetical protein LY78DRAFT_332833 [Colletotrichum sublineola]|nr:hypothetical protein LY78DRAFT_332833 [Colletotrichum sublineola]
MPLEWPRFVLILATCHSRHGHTPTALIASIVDQNTPEGLSMRHPPLPAHQPVSQSLSLYSPIHPISLSLSINPKFKPRLLLQATTGKVYNTHAALLCPWKVGRLGSTYTEYLHRHQRL